VQVARDRYWPADDPITVTVNGTTLTGKVADVVRSEAGLATLFDRKVNRGNIRPFEDVVGKLMAERVLTALADAAPYEREIVAAMKYRRDFLADTTLAQPAPPPIAPVAPVTPPVEATASQQAP
jgi:predicted NAD/FAD-binding protein